VYLWSGSWLDDRGAGAHTLCLDDEVGPGERPGSERATDVVDHFEAGDRDEGSAAGYELAGHGVLRITPL
jgi:hypothetical protein